jgi:hypothetical protein
MHKFLCIGTGVPKIYRCIADIFTTPPQSNKNSCFLRTIRKYTEVIDEKAKGKKSLTIVHWIIINCTLVQTMDLIILTI